ncbi:MAG TPA: hypothetical protein PKK06_05700 [Phycisphaerae bacterium]|nr:hypothetical protein [Phycisphaerae bacterium]HNU44747.1 hypothetical protein [Phycisphaerae bacterium]
MFESLNNVDWTLLHQQKLVLLEMLGRQRDGSPEAEALSGIINLLDALQDDAAAIGRWVFPGGNEAEEDTSLAPASENPTDAQTAGQGRTIRLTLDDDWIEVTVGSPVAVVLYQDQFTVFFLTLPPTTCSTMATSTRQSRVLAARGGHAFRSDQPAQSCGCAAHPGTLMRRVSMSRISAALSPKNEGNHDVDIPDSWEA